MPYPATSGLTFSEASFRLLQPQMRSQGIPFFTRSSFPLPALANFTASAQRLDNHHALIVDCRITQTGCGHSHGS